MQSGNRDAVWVDIHKISPLADVMVHKTLILSLLQLLWNSHGSFLEALIQWISWSAHPKCRWILWL